MAVDPKVLEQLQSAELRYRSLIDLTLDGYWYVDLNDNILEVNKAACDMLGYSREEFLKMKIGQIEAVESPEEIKKHTEKMMRTGGDIFETKHRKKDGTLINVEVNTSVVKENNGTTAINAFVRDITDRKRYEERITAILKLYEMEFTGEDALNEYALEECVKLTDSKVGYFHLFNHDEQTIDLYIWSKDVYNNCTAKRSGHYPLERAGVWADSARSKKPVIHNDYPHNPNNKGLPEGHFPLQRHLGVPVIDRGKVVALVGVGNKEAPYNEEDVKQLQVFMNNAWKNIKERKMEAELAEKFRAFEIINKATMDREQRIVELKEEIANLKERLGQK